MVLVHEKGYQNLTVSDITEHANVGRTTFYRYFDNKLAILVKLHRHRFEKINIAPSNREGWFSSETNPNLVTLLKRSQHKGRFQSLLYHLGTELTLIQELINEALTDHFEQRLRIAFNQDELNLPIPVLARSLAGGFSWLIKWWVEEAQNETPEAMALYIQQSLRAPIIQALIDSNL